ncbi:064f8156-4dfc-4f37-90d6-8a04fc08ac99 [Sclerotinia trifoliorum]|uniref:064f8156-4dfc-4f37-90d6-8a04fc08ac99 n=1 Tax=Sclerotinia trifoliorum TaxID=28548 RepID=A0A8H2VRY5_9HELO|nr:064f8156-4dfc-4f37-90d6-8a04fc08ac99 [Sclerotinia trifoliorum]
MATTEESPRSQKRDFAESFGLIEPFHVDENERAHLENPNTQAEPDIPLPSKETADKSESKTTSESLPTPPVSIQLIKREREREVSPASSTASSLSDLGSRSTPSLRGVSPMLGTAFAALNGNGDAGKEEEEKRKRKAAKEEKKRLKDEEKRKRMKRNRESAASQRSLFPLRQSFKDEVSTSPASSSLTMAVPPTTSAHSTPSKKEISPYEKMFPAFFVQNGVRLAPINHFERDDEGSQALQSIIDSYISGNQSPGRNRDFDAMELFHLSSSNSIKRGKSIVAVREIMAELSGNPSKPIDLTTDSQNSHIKRTTAQLKDVPMKFLKFQEDVRPPYQGTYTHTPMYGISKLARNPMRRDLPNTNYDYDSEAEWIEDEDAEDLNSEGEEDEEGLDDAEDMDGFLDDENDDLLNSRRALGGMQGDLEPVSTGLCWEDRKKRSTNVKMMPFRMEFIIDPKTKSMDPFSTQYWEPIAPSSQTGTMDPPRLPLNSMKSTNALQTSPSASTSKSSNKISNHKTVPLSFFGSSSSPSPSISSSLPLHPATGDNKPKKFLPDSDLPAFKEAIQGSDLSKVGLVEVLKKKFPGRTAGAIKATLDLVAKRVGGKESEKRWVLV